MLRMPKILMSGLLGVALGVVVGSVPYSISNYQFRNFDAGKVQNVTVQHNGGAAIADSPDYGNLTWQEAIAHVKTPEGAKDYINWMRSRQKWDNGKHMYSFKSIHEGAPVDCTEAATAAAALLSDDGYQPLELILAERTKWSHNGFVIQAHTVFVYKQNGKFGSVGINDTDYVAPTYNSIDELTRELSTHLISSGFRPTRYALINMGENRTNFISGDGDMQKTQVFDHSIPE